MIDHKNFLINLTEEPGIYKMLDEDGVVIYVGKAKNLKKRVASYFSSKSHGTKTRALLKKVFKIDIITTQNDIDALLLENQLIKTHQPKYNILLKDDKTYPYIYVNIDHDFPRFMLLRCKKKTKKGLYLGPYPSSQAVKDTLKLIQGLFKIRNCTELGFSHRSRPCLQYQINRCSAPCVKYISKEDYAYSIENAITFLNGKSNLILEKFKKDMQNAVELLDFEKAAKLRDIIYKLQLIQTQQGIIKDDDDGDIVVIKINKDNLGSRIDINNKHAVVVHHLTIRDGLPLQKETFFPVIPLDYDDTELYTEVFLAFARYYYAQNINKIPKKILIYPWVKDTIDIEALLKSWGNSKFKIIKNSQNKFAKHWLDLALKNAEIELINSNKYINNLQHKYLLLQKLLELQNPIARMECIDISHTQGQDTRASCVVFDNNGPLKSEYRYFIVRDIIAGDDCAAIAYAVHKRFYKKNRPMPDLLIIDGGKAQVKSAIQALEKLGITIKVIGISKGKERKVGLEKLIINNNTITLGSHSPILHLLQWIRDESHRYALYRHKLARDKVK